MPDPIAIHDASALERLRKELRVEPGLVRRWRIAFFKKSLGAEAALAELPPTAREAFATRVRPHALTLDRRLDSDLDGATKLIFKTDEGFLVESVVLRAGTGRVALCVSSQVGCAAKCDFCATGRMGMAHSLSAAEILDQMVQANELLRDEGRRVRNLVFMGMGEPLHNEAALHETIQSLTDPAIFDHPPSRVLVSTVGLPAGMLRLAERFPAVNQALSLHAVRQETRERIIPLARKAPLGELRDTIAELNRVQPERTGVMIEHLMLAGVNDSPEEAHELATWLDGLRVHVNLIPYNRVEAAPHLSGSSEATRKAFADVLKAAGHPTTIRYSMGADIEAACGQLVRGENRAVAKQLAVLRD
ncbi:Ribosomal RNA large subunit methyltransferase Cfr [Pseudobythopirellula maris]|uniref:Ribosomal RNA large subunit methyltransferase Cfr n=1 Tax=Pseudobythopirellula maris TaxID=2527991 RepID=A0A5C5ZTP8_9BACT|nr:23S rRNA (adenine(2503)-C(2))-methyltransferase RlmN [Pseudobythopirellula maris]TWT90902.1 Ribosomal RNA large subunit methyltransferase Cfr [Pseudobythopirellula maris]